MLCPLTPKPDKPIRSDKSVVASTFLKELPEHLNFYSSTVNLNPSLSEICQKMK